MAGRGPAGKDPALRQRRNKAPEVRTLQLVNKVTQPDLPEGISWPEITTEWWQMWGQSPQAETFGPTDWDFLLDTALLHADVWGNGNLDRLPELRIRVAKFGATPEDRVRLKMQYADAEVKTDAAERANERRTARRAVKGKPVDPREILRGAGCA